MNETAAEKKRRLRFLTLAEFVGVAALIIAGLGYWDAHRERAQSDRDHAAEVQEKKAQAKAGALKLSFLMTGTPESGGERLRLSTVHSGQVIQTQAISFPAEIRGDSVQTTGNPRLEAGWVDDGLTKAEHARGGKSHAGRIPMGIVTVFMEDGEAKTDRAIYLVGYRSHARVLRADKVELEGLSLVRRGVGEDVQAAVDAAWARSNPPPAKP